MTTPEHRDRRSARAGRVGLLQGSLRPARGPLAPSAGGPRYRLRPSIEPFVDGAGHLYLVRPGAPDLVVRNAEAGDVALVEALAAGPADVAALAAAAGIDAAAVRTKLDSLLDADVVLISRPSDAPPLGSEDLERFSRQLPYLAELGDEQGLQRRLRDATVAVIGCGGLGTWTIAALVSVGVGHLVLVDHDLVELSNLNRQVLYRRDAVGERKVAAAAAWVRSFDPAVRVTAVDRRIEHGADLPPLLGSADAVVLAADWPPYEIGRWVNAACLSRRIPFTVAGQVPPILKVGPTYVPGDGPCFACHEAALRRASPAYDDYVAWRRSRPVTASTLGPASGVVGALLGLELMHLLAGRRPATHGAAVIVDMRTLEIRREEVPRDAGCPACDDLR